MVEDAQQSAVDAETYANSLNDTAMSDNLTYLRTELAKIGISTL